MMLSRVAESLYWMSRYLERALHSARVMEILLDLDAERSLASARIAVQHVKSALYVPEAPSQDARAMLRLAVFSRENPNSVVSSIAMARENARQVREQISTEVWEHINRLYLHVTTFRSEDLWKDEPQAFFQTVREGLFMVSGAVHGTMPHGQGWAFMQVGHLLERAMLTTTYLRAWTRSDETLPVDTTDAYLDAVGVLRACGGLEAYNKRFGADARMQRVATFLLLDEELPSSVRFSISALQESLRKVAEIAGTHKTNAALRRTGKLLALLDYTSPDEVEGQALPEILSEVLSQAADIHTALGSVYFNYDFADFSGMS